MAFDRRRQQCKQPTREHCQKRGERFDDATHQCLPDLHPSTEASRSTDEDQVSSNTELQRTIDRFYAPDALVHIDIEMPAQEWSSLRNEQPYLGVCKWISEAVERFTWRKARLRISFGDDLAHQQFEEVAIRKKSWCWSFDTKRPSLRIDIDREDKRNASLADGFMGVRTVVLNNSKQDLSLIRQCLAYKLLREAAVPAPRCNFAAVRVNEEDLGVYVNVEAVQDPLLEQAFGSSAGDLFEIAGTDVIEEFLTRTLVPPGETLESVDALEHLAKWLDVDAYLRFWAMETVLLNWDSYSYGINNSYAFRAASDGKFRLIAWGADQALQGDWLGSQERFSNSYPARLLLASPKYKHAYCEEVQSALARVQRSELATINAMAHVIKGGLLTWKMDPFIGQEQLDCWHGWCLEEIDYPQQVTLLKNVYSDVHAHVRDHVLEPLCGRNPRRGVPEEHPLKVDAIVGLTWWGSQTSAQRDDGRWLLRFDGMGDGNRYIDRRQTKKNAAMYVVSFKSQDLTRLRSLSFDLSLSPAEQSVNEEELWLSIAVWYGPDGWRWVESRATRLRNDTNHVTVDFTRHNWKEEETQWQYGVMLPRTRRARFFALKIVNKRLGASPLAGTALFENLTVAASPAVTAPTRTATVQVQ